MKTLRNSVACAAVVAASISAAACGSDNNTPVTPVLGTGGISGTGGIFNAGGTTATGGTSAGGSTGACVVSTAIEHAYAVTSSNFMYFFDGGTTGNPALTLKRGRTYEFDIAVESIHPFAITVAKALPATLFTNGVSGQGTSGITAGKITFAVPCDAPATLDYQCTVHGFGNTITTE